MGINEISAEEAEEQVYRYIRQNIDAFQNSERMRLRASWNRDGRILE